MAAMKLPPIIKPTEILTAFDALTLGILIIDAVFLVGAYSKITNSRIIVIRIEKRRRTVNMGRLKENICLSSLMRSHSLDHLGATESRDEIEEVE